MSDAHAPRRVSNAIAGDAAKRRALEIVDAADFLLRGEAEHQCALDPPCTRDYEPGERPADERMYRGTGIGALFGLGGEQHLWQLAGWNVRRLTDPIERREP